MKLVMLVVLVLLTSTCGSSQVVNDKLIVPGKRIGKWTLDMTMADLVRMNGEVSPAPAGADFADVIWRHSWYFYEVHAFTHGETNPRIAALVVTDSVYKTTKGVGRGTSRRSVEAAYGKPTTITMVLGNERWIYDRIGLFAVIGGNVGVFRPGTAKTVWKF